MSCSAQHTKEVNIMPTENEYLVEGLIEGLMILGRSREEAIDELRQNEERQNQNAQDRLWDSPKGAPEHR